MNSRRERMFAKHIRSQLLIVAMLTIVALLVIFVGPRLHSANIFTSSEVHFADTSQKGLAIVPASCPSDPHYPGECNKEPPPDGKCAIWAEEPSIPPGQSTHIGWRTGLGHPDRPACAPYTKCIGGLQKVELSDLNTVIFTGTAADYIGSHRVTPPPDTATPYMLTATYEGYGWDNLPVIIRCSASVATNGLCGLVAQRENIIAGESTNLLWSTTDTNGTWLPAWYYNNKLEMDNGIGVIFNGKGNSQGSISVTPSQTTTYTVTAQACFTTTGVCGNPQICKTTVLVKSNGNKYTCNSNNQCISDPNGQYTNSNCNNACAPAKFSCSSNNQCVSDPNGAYTTSNCDNACTGGGTKYKCNTSTKQCAIATDGTYNTAASCNADCSGSGIPRFSCDTSNQCLLDPYGPYSSSSCNEGCGKCPEGYIWVNDGGGASCTTPWGTVVADGQTATGFCPDYGGGVIGGGACGATKMCKNGQWVNPNLPGGTPGQGRCEPINCPPGTMLQGSRCVPVSCPPGQIKNAQGICECPRGSDPDAHKWGVCAQCTERYYCAGDNLRHIDTQCVDSFVRQCYAGCANNACLAFPPPDADFTVKPALVRRNDLTNVSWSARHVTSCTVTGTNGDGTGQNATGVWNTVSGTKQSSPITGKTTYTLTCWGQDESTLKKSLDVNIIPDWVEL